jgi:uncharacterized protein (TIGR04540 family)
MEILKNPTTIKLLSQQIIIACDEYLSLKLSEHNLRELLLYYATNHGNKLFKGTKLNPTLLNRIGKKRAELVEHTLSGFQIRL